jgi:hypothetical protein
MHIYTHSMWHNEPLLWLHCWQLLLLLVADTVPPPPRSPGASAELLVTSVGWCIRYTSSSSQPALRPTPDLLLLKPTVLTSALTRQLPDAATQSPHPCCQLLPTPVHPMLLWTLLLCGPAGCCCCCRLHCIHTAAAASCPAAAGSPAAAAAAAGAVAHLAHYAWLPS